MGELEGAVWCRVAAWDMGRWVCQGAVRPARYERSVLSAPAIPLSLPIHRKCAALLTATVSGFSSISTMR